MLAFLSLSIIYHEVIFNSVAHDGSMVIACGLIKESYSAFASSSEDPPYAGSGIFPPLRFAEVTSFSFNIPQRPCGQLLHDNAILKIVYTTSPIHR